MKFSSKIEKCGLSPMRKFAPYANEAAKKLIKTNNIKNWSIDPETGLIKINDKELEDA